MQNFEERLRELPMETFNKVCAKTILLPLPFHQDKK